MESCITGFICTRICTPAELKILMKNVDCLKMVMPSKEKREKEKVLYALANLYEAE